MIFAPYSHELFVPVRLAEVVPWRRELAANVFLKAADHRHSAPRTRTEPKTRANTWRTTRPRDAEVLRAGSRRLQVLRSLATAAEKVARCRYGARPCWQPRAVLRSIRFVASDVLLQSSVDEPSRHPTGQRVSESSTGIGSGEDLVGVVERGGPRIRCPVGASDHPRIGRSADAFAKGDRGGSPQDADGRRWQPPAGAPQNGLGVVELRPQKGCSLAPAFRGAQRCSDRGKDYGRQKLRKEGDASNVGGRSVLRNRPWLRAVSSVSGDRRHWLVVRVLCSRSDDLGGYRGTFRV